MGRLKILALALFCCNVFCQESNQAEEVSISDNTTQTEHVNSITGFYGGADLGMDLLKQKAHNNSSNTGKSKSKPGLLLDAFVGYNFQLGKFIFGLEGILDFRTATPKTSINSKTFSLKRKYGFGLAPKIGYNIYNSLNGYVNFGTLTSKYKIRGNNQKSNPTKTSMFVGLGLEQTFGTMFVRGEVNKVFKKTISKISSVGMSADSYTFKIGGGYRF